MSSLPEGTENDATMTIGHQQLPSPTESSSTIPVPSKRNHTFSEQDDPLLSDSSWLDYSISTLGLADLNDLACLEDGGGGTESQFNQEQEHCEGSLSSLTHATVQHIGQQIGSWLDLTGQPRTHVTSEVNSPPVLAEDEAQASSGPKCFGRIHGVSTRFEGNPSSLQAQIMQSKASGGAARLLLSPLYNIIWVNFEDGTKFGQLGNRLTEALRSVRGIESVSFDAFLDVQQCLRLLQSARRSDQLIVDVDINVYGSAEVRDAVGSCLSRHRVYLQHPQYLHGMYEYDNPHMMDFGSDFESGDEETMQADLCCPEPTLEEGEEVVLRRICQQESRDRGLEALDGSALVKTCPLFPWQKEAVAFMSQRETGPIPDEFRLWRQEEGLVRPRYRHILTGECTSQQPPETGGGILAHDMGMGKTLSALAHIARTLPEAVAWSGGWQSSQHTPSITIATRATLIVLPSLQVMGEWCREVKTHLVDSVQVVRYHGKRRGRLEKKICASDIVLTTYHTLAADRKTGRAVLNQISWFRILLDEAHTIRQPQTTLFASVMELQSTRRWCVTGTPIQNRLEDLGALMAFIRAEPLDNPILFRKYVMLPFHDDMRQGSGMLSLLLNSVCLRRTSKCLQLPRLDEKVHVVQFSPEERKQYDETLTLMTFAISHGNRDKRQKMMKVPYGRFQIQLQLRLICNHGTFQKPFSWSGMDLQSQREDIAQAMGADGTIACSRCHSHTPVLATNCVTRYGPEGQPPVLCNECEECHLDESEVLTPASTPGDSGVRSTHTGVTRRTRAKFISSGISSKIKILLRHMLEDVNSTKSIVFSCWTKTLDLIEQHLEGEKISFLRVDGDTSQGRRQPILDDFTRDDDARILLMTTGTGAYGLNLAKANRVFLVEPHWNPSVELQAIARAQRHPQTKQVQVHRYVVSDTVEKHIQRQQKAKKQVARAGFEHANADRAP